MGQRFYHLLFGKKGDALFSGAPWIEVVINERAGKEMRQYFFEANSAVAFVRTNCEADVEKEALEAEKAKLVVIARRKPDQESRIEKIETDLVGRISQIDADKGVLIRQIETHFKVHS